jgi:hypothetical protein
MNHRTGFERQDLRWLGTLAVLLLTACGSSSEGSGSQSTDGTTFPKELLPRELLPDLPLVAPKSDRDTPLFSGIVEVGPGEDVTFCTFTDLIVDQDTIFGETFGAESPHGHHAILQYTTTPQEPHTGACADMDGPILLGGSGGKNVAQEPTLPTNFGLTVPAGAQLVINHHWINTSHETIKGQAMVLARRLPDDGTTVAAGSLPMLGLGWEIPALGRHTYSTECTFAQDVPYVLALGHMHEYGTRVTIDVKRTDGAIDTLIDEPWTPDSGTTAGGRIFTLEDPYVIHKGDTVTLTCNWENSTSEAVGFPREMCIFFGYTIGANAYCVNGGWFTGDQLGGTGVNPQDITDHL